jgi:hypothetical protein
MDGSGLTREIGIQPIHNPCSEVHKKEPENEEDERTILAGFLEVSILSIFICNLVLLYKNVKTTLQEEIINKHIPFGK